MSAMVICRPLPEPAGAPDVESEDLLQLVTRNTPVARSKAVSLVKVMQNRDERQLAWISGFKFVIRVQPRLAPSSELLGRGARSGSTKRALASADISRSRE